MCMCVCMHYGVHVEVRGCLEGVSSLCEIEFTKVEELAFSPPKPSCHSFCFFFNAFVMLGS